jgi:hypothetical protein
MLILHDDFATYIRAVEVCRRVMERFDGELDFDLKCWSCIELADFHCARHAAKSAGAADIILLSLPDANLPPELDRWLEFHFAARFKAEGVLALVLNPLATAPAAGCALLRQLEETTGRLGMDFLSLRAEDGLQDLELPVPPAFPPAPWAEARHEP